MILENWKAVCESTENEVLVIDMQAFDHMDVFNRTFSMKNVKKLVVAIREKHYTEEKKNEFWNRYKN